METARCRSRLLPEIASDDIAPTRARDFVATDRVSDLTGVRQSEHERFETTGQNGVSKG
jgi:hypothetical protein